MVGHREKREKARKTNKVRVSHTGGAFKPGNQVAVGHDAVTPAKHAKILTQTLISMINELDEKSGKEKYYTLVDKLYNLAVAGDGNLEAIKYIFDRVDGKMISALFGNGDDDNNGSPFEFTLKMGHVGQDGTKSAAEIRLRPSVAVS